MLHSVAKHTSRHITCLPALILPYYYDAHLMGKDLLDRSCRAVCHTLSLSSGTSLCVCSFNEFVKTGSSEGFRRLRRLKLSCDWLRIYNSDNSRINVTLMSCEFLWFPELLIVYVKLLSARCLVSDL